MLRKKRITPDAARIRMADLCARSEQCEADIRDKLRRQMLPQADIDDIVEFLIGNKFIDDTRFARSFANDKVRFAGWGKNKIRMALKAKRISSSVITGAIDEIDDEEYYRTLLKIATNKIMRLDIDEYEDRAKLYRYLLSRGFESSLVVHVLSDLKENNQ